MLQRYDICADQLSAIGGECETKTPRKQTRYLKTVEVYNPIHNIWTDAAEMKEARSFAAVTILEGKAMTEYSYHQAMLSAKI